MDKEDASKVLKIPFGFNGPYTSIMKLTKLTGSTGLLAGVDYEFRDRDGNKDG